MTSRERMLRALSLQEVDRVPCCFMSFTALRKRHRENLFELAKAERALGFDSMLFIPAAPRQERLEHPDLRGLPVRFSPEVRVREWIEQSRGRPDRLHREYSTPAGILTTSVHSSDDWPHGPHLPFVDDYQIPRTDKPLVTGPEDLAPLSFLLTPPSREEIRVFEQEVEVAKSFAAAEGILLSGGWGVGADMADWLCGIQNLMILMIDHRAFAAELMEMIHRWNLARMRVVLTAPVDLFIRRAWYEGVDFVPRSFFREVLLPQLRAEVDLAHEHGAKFGYICSSGTTPLLAHYLDAGIDVLIGVDPVEGTYTDMPLMKREFGCAGCLWGGVSGAVTVEMGSEIEVRSAVRRAMLELGPRGFILSPVDNITVDAPLTWRNLEFFIDEWRQCRQPNP